MMGAFGRHVGTRALETVRSPETTCKLVAVLPQGPGACSALTSNVTWLSHPRSLLSLHGLQFLLQLVVTIRL